MKSALWFDDVQLSEIIKFAFMNKAVFPVAERPGQYVAFFVVQIATMEGPGFVYMAADAFSEFAFHLGVDKNENPETILKYIYLLTENPDFIRNRDRGFTLVMDDFDELSDRINAIINHVNGKLLFNKKYNNYISSPVLKSFNDFLIKRR